MNSFYFILFIYFFVYGANSQQKLSHDSIFLNCFIYTDWTLPLMAKHFVECGNSLHIVISSTHLSTGQPTAWFRWHVCCFSLRRPPSSSCQNAKCEGGTASHLKNLSTNNHSVCLCCGSGVPESRPNFTALFNTVISNCWATDRRKWLLEFTRNYRWSKTSRTLSEQLSTRSGTAETWIVFFYHVSKSTYTMSVYSIQTCSQQATRQKWSAGSYTVCALHVCCGFTDPI